MENDQAAAAEIITVEVNDAVGVVTMRTPSLTRVAKERLLAALRQLDSDDAVRAASPPP
ncbi:MAG TPA: hypothetical protein VF838_16040 [Trebonia sp.]